MRDSYMADEEVGKIVRRIELTDLSPEAPRLLRDALVEASEITGVSVTTLVTKLIKELRRSSAFNMTRQEFLVNWLSENFPTHGSSRR